MAVSPDSHAPAPSQPQPKPSLRERFGFRGTPIRVRNVAQVEIGRELRTVVQLGTLENDMVTYRIKTGTGAGALFTRMSGSGATCFALFAKEDAAIAAAEALRADHPDWWATAGIVYPGRADMDQLIRATT